MTNMKNIMTTTNGYMFIYTCILTLATIHKLTIMKEGVST